MNRYLSSRYVEVIQSPLLGLEARDAARGQRAAQRLDIVLEPQRPWPMPPDADRYLTTLRERGRRLEDICPRLDRHASGLFVLRFRADAGNDVDLRVVDRSERFVPRRIRVPLVPLGSPPSLSLLDRTSMARRFRRLALFPGAAYPVSESVTGLRGRAVIREGVPPRDLVARWPRVEALDDGGATIAVAHGDQHGEFLLLLPPAATDRLATLPNPFNLNVRVTGRKPVPAPPSALYAAVDPFWDLPIEVAGPPGSSPDDVMAGTAAIPHYNASATRLVTFTFGATVSTSGHAPFKLT